MLFEEVVTQGDNTKQRFVRSVCVLIKFIGLHHPKQEYMYIPSIKTSLVVFCI